MTESFIWGPNCLKFCLLLLCQKPLKVNVAHGSRFQSITVGTSRQQELETVVVTSHPVQSREHLINAHVLALSLLSPPRQSRILFPKEFCQYRANFPTPMNIIMAIHLRYAHNPRDLDNPPMSPFPSDSSLCQVNNSISPPHLVL